MFVTRSNEPTPLTTSFHDFGGKTKTTKKETAGHADITFFYCQFDDLNSVANAKPAVRSISQALFFANFNSASRSLDRPSVRPGNFNQAGLAWEKLIEARTFGADKNQGVISEFLPRLAVHVFD